MEDSARKTHPMIIVAAIAVTVASLAAIASFTGLLPGKSAPESTLTATVPPPPPEAAPIAAPPAPRTAKAEHFAPPPPSRAHKTQQADARQPAADRRSARAQRAVDRHVSAQRCRNRRHPGPPQPARRRRSAATAAPSKQCAKSARRPKAAVSARSPAASSAACSATRSVSGKGNTAATIVGAVGGAVAGHQTEKYVRAEKQLQVTVRFEDGSTRTVAQEGGSRWQVGDRVRLNNGSLLPN